jgi:inhibitor of cysteine peptidase
MSLIELGEADDGQARAVTVGDEVAVVLDETPTSGYRWALAAFDEGIVAARDDEFRSEMSEPGMSEPGRMGAAGRHTFRFVVVGPGSTALRLVQRRSWDPDAVAGQFEVRIEASPAGDPRQPSIDEIPP